jgi:hypothetical protein
LTQFIAKHSNLAFVIEGLAANYDDHDLFYNLVSDLQNKATVLYTSKEMRKRKRENQGIATDEEIVEKIEM